MHVLALNHTCAWYLFQSLQGLLLLVLESSAGQIGKIVNDLCFLFLLGRFLFFFDSGDASVFGSHGLRVVLVRCLRLIDEHRGASLSLGILGMTTNRDCLRDIERTHGAEGRIMLRKLIKVLAC